MHGPRRYTLHLMPNNTYRIKIDNEEAAKGSLYEDWEFEAPKQIRVRAARLRPCLQFTSGCCRVKPGAYGIDAAEVCCLHGMLGVIVLTWAASRACISQRPVVCPLTNLAHAGGVERGAEPARGLCAGPQGDQAGGLGRAGHNRGPRGQEGAAAGSARIRVQLPTWPLLAC